MTAATTATAPRATKRKPERVIDPETVCYDADAMLSAYPRFWAKVDASGDCWQWLGAKNSFGYGRLTMDKRFYQAHRLSYILLVSAIPDGLVIDHLCRNHGCVNPDHLRIVTRQVNTLVGYNIAANNSKKRQCLRGHPFDVANTRYLSDGSRYCRACKRLRRRESRERTGRWD